MSTRTNTKSKAKPSTGSAAGGEAGRLLTPADEKKIRKWILDAIETRISESYAVNDELVDLVYDLARRIIKEERTSLENRIRKQIREAIGDSELTKMVRDVVTQALKEP